MSAISLKSITGITSITTPAGVDNQLTLHTNNTTERVKIDIAGNVHVNNHLNISGIVTATTIKSSNLTSGRVVFTTTGGQLEGSGNLTYNGTTLVSGSPLDINGDLDVDGHTNLDNVNIAGVTTTSDNIFIQADNKYLSIGAHSGGDLLAYHDGNKSVIVNYTGDFHIRTNNGSRSSLEGIILKPNGATEIYHSGSKIIETDSLGVNVDGRLDVVGTGANDHLNVGTNTGRLRIGGYADLQLYHDSTNINYISNHNDIDLHITSTYGGSPVKTQAKFIHNGAVELYHNNDLRLQTWSDAVNILGDEGEDAILHLYADEGDNNEDKWMLRAESSAQRFSIENYSSGSWVENIRITAGGLVELKHADGTTRMHTDSTGITVANRITGSGDSNTYINVGPNDIIDLYTGGSNVIRMNASGNLLVSKATTSDYGKLEVKGGTADNIETADITAKTVATFSGSTPGTTAAGKGVGIVIKPISNRGCNYFFGVANDSANQEAHGRFIIRSGNFAGTTSERLRIDSSGHITPGTNNSQNIGNGTTNFASIWASTRFRGNDDVKLVLGDSQDLVVRHSGGVNYIESPQGGNLFIKSGTGDNANLKQIQCNHGGSVLLYYNDGERVKTTADGVEFGGEVNFTSGYNVRTFAGAVYLTDGQHADIVAHNSGYAWGFFEFYGISYHGSIGRCRWHGSMSRYGGEDNYPTINNSMSYFQMQRATDGSNANIRYIRLQRTGTYGGVWCNYYVRCYAANSTSSWSASHSSTTKKYDGN